MKLLEFVDDTIEELNNWIENELDINSSFDLSNHIDFLDDLITSCNMMTEEYWNETIW